MSEYQHTISFVDSSDAVTIAEFRDAWDELAHNSSNLFALFQSPVWWDKLNPLPGGERSVIGVLRGDNGTPVGVVPMYMKRYCLEFKLHNWRLAGFHFQLMKMLGDQPLLPSSESCYIEFFHSLFHTFKESDGIYLEWIPFGSYIWNILSSSQTLKKEFIVYQPTEPDICTLIEMPSSFEEYLATFSKKTRHNFRTQVNRLRKLGNGRLDLVRIEHEEQVKEFLDTASSINLRSTTYRKTGWAIPNSPEECNKYIQLCQAGVLRSYLLRCGSEVCAFARGFQYGDTFQYQRTGFDDRFSKYSPGAVMLYLFLEDLFGHRPPKRVNFSVSADYWYKKFFGNKFVCGNGIIVLQKTPRNYMRIRLHATYRIAFHFAQRVVALRNNINWFRLSPKSDSNN
jgi:CelD/BcsL family acetyltransferase involved in cellulose biosynthesis